MSNVKLPRRPKDLAKRLSNVSKFLAGEWDYSLNAVTPEDISYGSIFKVWWLCSVCGYSWQTSVNNRFLKGSGCPKCSSKSRSNSQKLCIDFIKQGVHKLGFWEVLSEEYISAKSKLLCKCTKCGRVHKICWDKLRLGQRCPYCMFKNFSKGRKAITPKNKLNLDFIKTNFLTEGFVVTSTVYIRSNIPIDYICPSGHKHSITWDNWKQGKRCFICAKINMSGPNHPDWLGGKSFEPYCSIWKDTDYKESIKERDNHVCQNPYCFKTDKILNIHHIDYDKKNCHPSNLITVCRSCNAKANKDRVWHKEWYQALMNKKYRFIYKGV